MVFHMAKTTLNIDDNVMRELKREAARQGKTMSELVETALRQLLQPKTKREKLPPLPTFRARCWSISTTVTRFTGQWKASDPR